LETTKSLPLGGKSYGTIGHLPGSRMGPGDRKMPAGQQRIAVEAVRDKYDQIVVQEKLDGSNCTIARINGSLYPLTRAGNLARTSPFEQHWRFAEWVYTNQDRFLAVLQDGERLCGEWLLQAHGTRYELPHEPFVVFDLMRGQERATLSELTERVKGYGFVQPRLLHVGGSFSLEAALQAIAVSGHGALDPVEGAVWRVERYEKIALQKGSGRAWKVDFLAKYVRPDKKDGIYLPGIAANKEPVWNQFKQDLNSPWLSSRVEVKTQQSV